MALSLSDFLMGERGGALYKLTGQDIVNLCRDEFGTTDYRVADIAARNALAGLSVGDMILVDDASADATVASGWAIYRSMGVGLWTKIAEEESLDITLTTTDLGMSRTATSVTITNTDGTDATIPMASVTEAGVMTAAHATILSLITISGAVDLDAIALASHDPATAGGSSANNPVNINAAQIVTVSISQLANLP